MSDAVARAHAAAVDQLVKSMVFDADGEIVVALTSGGSQVDGNKLAALALATSCRGATK